MALRGNRRRAVLVLFKDGFTMRQIARALGLKIADVCAAIRRAL